MKIEQKTINTKSTSDESNCNHLFKEQMREVLEVTGIRLYKRGHWYADVPYILALMLSCFTSSDQCSVANEKKKY